MDGPNRQREGNETMTALLNNTRVEMNTDYANDERDGALTIAFDHAGRGEVIEWLDEDGSLCSDWDSNLRDEYEEAEFDDVRSQLQTWLAAYATVSVAMNRSADFYVLTVSADTDSAAIVEAECLSIGSVDDSVWDGVNGVRVYRNGIEVPELAQEARARRAA